MNILFINGSPNKNGNTAALAAELLAGTPCRVYEVARLTGFEGNKHFYGLFQKAYGVTPTQYHETQYEETEQSKE